MVFLAALNRLGIDARYLIASSTIRSLTGMGITGVLLNLYVIRLGYGPIFIGLFNGIAIVTGAGISPIAGALGRRWGARRSMLTGLAIAVSGGLLLPLADLLPGNVTTAWLVGTNVVALVGSMLFYVNLTPYLAAVTGPRERSTAFSVRFSLQLLGSSVGSVMGGLLPGAFTWITGAALSNPSSYRFALLVGAGLLLAAVFFVQRGREVQAGPEVDTASGPRSTPWKLLVLVGIVSFMVTPAEAAAWIFFNVYADTVLRVPTVQIGFVVASAQLLGVPVALMMPAAGSRLGTGRAAALSAFGIALSLLPMALIPHFAAAGLGFVGVLTFGAILAPALNVYLTEVAPGEWLSSATGVSLGGTAAAFGLVSLGGGFLITALGYTGFFLISALVTAVGVLVFRATLLRGGAFVAALDDYQIDQPEPLSPRSDY